MDSEEKVNQLNIENKIYAHKIKLSHCRFPYKFVVQVIKIVLVTMQLCLFAHSRYNHVNYTWDNRITFSHLFLLNWIPEMEVNLLI